MRDSWVPADHAADEGGLSTRVAKGLTWTLIDNWGAQLLGLGILVVLLRLVGVEDVGLVALAAAIVGLVQLFVDQGLGDALIQRPSLTRGHIDTAFWAAVLTGTLLTLFGIVAAAPLATLVGEPRLAPIVQVLSVSFVLTALSSVQMALLRREMAFRSLAARRLIAIGGGGIVGIAMAFLGFGAWALVGQQLAQAALSVVTLWAVSPWRPGREVSWADFRSLFGFGANIVAGDLLFYLGRNMDTLLIGTFLGPIALGTYAVGFRFLDASTAMLVTAARKLGFPTFARLQHDRDRLRRAYTRMSRAMAAVTLPGYVGLALVAEQAIVLLAGEQWRASGAIATVLILTGPAQAVQAYSGAVLNGIGHPEVTLRYRLLTATLNIAGFLVAVLVFRSVIAVAAAYALRAYVMAPIGLRWLETYAGIPFRENVLRLRRIAGATVLMAGAVLAAKVAIPESAGLFVSLAVEVAVGIAVYGATMLLLERALLVDLWHFALQALPGRVRSRLSREPRPTTPRPRRRSAEPGGSPGPAPASPAGADSAAASEPVVAPPPGPRGGPREVPR
jgi:O-antigen/teichoic acid export membrane protein